MSATLGEDVKNLKKLVLHNAVSFIFCLGSLYTLFSVFLFVGGWGSSNFFVFFCVPEVLCWYHHETVHSPCFLIYVIVCKNHCHISVKLNNFEQAKEGSQMWLPPVSHAFDHMIFNMKRRFIFDLPLRTATHSASLGPATSNAIKSTVTCYCKPVPTRKYKLEIAIF